MDNQKLYEKLTEAFLLYQWRLDNPMPDPEDKRKAENAYLRDVYFHNKVQSIVSGVMHILNQHLEEE